MKQNDERVNTVLDPMITVIRRVAEKSSAA